MRYIARLSRLVWALNIVLLTVVLSLIAVSVFPTRPSQDTAVTSHPGEQAKGFEAPNGTHPDPVNAKLILDRDIFRVGAKAAEEAKKAQSVLPERPKVEPRREVPLRLLGTVVDPGGASYAVIENAAVKSQDVYRVGDAIGDARVNRIEQNRVVVLSAGMLETLDLAVTGQSPGAAKGVAQAPVPVPVPVSTGSGEVLRVTSVSDRQINTRASGENVSKAAEFLQKMKLTPHETSGKADGLAISGLGDSALAQLSGLKDGDVIETINGHPVPNEAKAAQVLKKARSLGSARIELKSGQESKALTFSTASW